MKIWFCRLFTQNIYAYERKKIVKFTMYEGEKFECVKCQYFAKLEFFGIFAQILFYTLRFVKQ